MPQERIGLLYLVIHVDQEDAVERIARQLRVVRLAQLDADIVQPLALHARRSEEHTSELQSLMRISYAVFCLKKKLHTRSYTNHKYSTLIPTTYIPKSHYTSS